MGQDLVLCIKHIKSKAKLAMQQYGNKKNAAFIERNKYGPEIKFVSS
jgi:hypothetical protein